MRFDYLEFEFEIRALIEWHNANSRSVVIDFETTDKNPRKAKLIDIQMEGYEPGHVVMFDARFLPLLLAFTTTLVGWNLKYDLKVAFLHGTDLRGKKWRDGMLLHHLVDENAPHDLDSLVQAEYGDDFKEAFWREFKDYPSAPFERRLDYGCKDIIYTRRIFDSLSRECVSVLPLVEHVHRLAASLLNTEIEGLPVDLEFTIQMGSDLKGGILDLERQLRVAGGHDCEIIELRLWGKEIEKAYTPNGKKWKTIEKPEFNFSSSKQVCALLYDQLKLPVQISQKTKTRTADDDALEELELLHPLIPLLRQYRKLSTMYGTFVEGVLDRAENSVIYPSFNVNGTKTGRISHSDPNMGNMPSKGEWSRIRGIFVPRPGYKIVSADYGQLEVAIAAHFSQDPNLLKIIHEGASKHDITAAGLGIERGLAKTLNFAMQYLCSPFKVRQLLGCTEKEALEVWQKYWDTYAGEKRVIDDCIGRIERGEAIENPFGRKRRFPGYKRPHWADPSVGKFDKAMRQAYNALTQGTGGDMMSMAFYQTAETLQERGWGRGLFTVHDEGLIEAKAERAAEATELLVSNMLAIGPAIGLTVPLTVTPSEPLDRWQK